jgi:stage II sporulation protein D
VVVVDGHGWGHGVGMAQDGAYWMAVDGASRDEILEHFYPGTGRGSNTGTDGTASLTFPQGGEVRSPRSGAQRRGFPVRIDPGGSVTVTHGPAGYRVVPSGGTVHAAQVGEPDPVPLPTASSTTSTSTTSTTTLLPSVTAPSTTTTTAPGETTSTTTPPQAPPPTTASPGVTSPEPVWAGPVSAGGTIGVPARSFVYRGELEVTAATGPLRVINDIDVEQYLWGLGEVGASFPPAALEAQIIAARTYALRAMAANGEICDTQRCQVYKGASGEFRGQLDAVSRTLGMTLGYGGRFASAVFSANAAGFSATPEEGFGTPNASHPYLVAAPYETRSPDVWQVRICLAELARRLHYPGTATSVRVASTGASGRPIEIEIDGDAGKVRTRALDVDSAMGLRSTFWKLRLTTADAAPDAPEAAALIQSAPEAVGAVIAEEERKVVRTRTTDAPRTTTTLALTTSPSTGDDHGAVPLLLILLVVAAGVAGFVVLVQTRDT